MSPETTIDLLLVDDDEELRGTTARWFTRQGFRVSEAEDGERALELARGRTFDVIVLDLMMPGRSGLEVLRDLKQAGSESEIVLLTGRATVESAVEAMKGGAFDYLVKPFALADLAAVVRRADERGRLRRENSQLKAILARSETPRETIGRSEAMREVFRLIDRAGPSGKAILIQGESGTGKELVAKALHRASARANKPLVVVNCAALPEPLLESELFGHEKGAFTGAVVAKPGLFEVADRGTLFIDEIGEMPPSLQAKLLRVLEDGSLRRVGSLQERRVDVRILAATNRDLAVEVGEGRFREDLYYRINVMALELPPLRERAGDVDLLIDHLLGPAWEVEAGARRLLAAYRWPGNVRQLANVIDRAKILADDGIVRVRDLPREIVGRETGAAAGPDGADGQAGSIDGPAHADDLAHIERAKVVEVLRRLEGNKSQAARALGVERRKLYRLIEKYAIAQAELEEALPS